MDIKETEVKPTHAVVQTVPATDEFFKKQIKKARDAKQPISQLMLAKQLMQLKDLSLREAEAIAEEYVHREDVPIPQYLSSEFGLVWMKVLAFVSILISIGIMYATVTRAQSVFQLVMGLVAGFIFCGLASFGWLKAIANGG